MMEDDLSHRGLMKLISAKLDYLIGLYKIEKFEEKNGKSLETLDKRTKLGEEYKKAIKHIKAKDRLMA